VTACWSCSSRGFGDRVTGSCSKDSFAECNIEYRKIPTYSCLSELNCTSEYSKVHECITTVPLQNLEQVAMGYFIAG
jgi:hypothetical protein